MDGGNQTQVTDDAGNEIEFTMGAVLSPPCVAGIAARDTVGNEYSCATIQDAVDMAGEGWEIEVGAGSYDESVFVKKKTGITIISYCDAVARCLIPPTAETALQPVMKEQGPPNVVRGVDYPKKNRPVNQHKGAVPPAARGALFSKRAPWMPEASIYDKFRIRNIYSFIALKVTVSCSRWGACPQSGKMTLSTPAPA